MSLCMRSHRKRAIQKFPLNSVSISGRVEGLALLLHCEYSYTNTLSDVGVEAEFVFPTPAGATVCGLTGEIDGRQIQGMIKEKGEAKESYDDAISSGYSAGIVEGVSSRDFRMILGNLSPNGHALLRIKLLSELELNNEGIACLNIPAAMLPQIGSELCKFSFELFIEKRVGEFSMVESTSHKISYKKEATREIVSIKDDFSAQHRDIEILMKPSFTDQPLVSTYSPQTTPPDPSHSYLSSHACMLTFIPKLDSGSTIPPAEFIFIIDRSGSMSGANIRHAKSTLELLLQSLSIGCYFNIIGFGSDYELLSSKKSLQYSQETLESSLKEVRKLKADLGGTCLLPPLRAALKLPTTESNLSRQIMILTDGETEDESKILKMVASSPQTFRVFSFGIGRDASRSLVSGVAVAGRGKAVYLQSADEMEQKVMQIMNLAFSPDLRDIEVEFSHPIDFYPTKVPNLFLNERLILYGFIKELPVPIDTQIQAKLSFTQEGKRQSLVSEFNLAPGTSPPQADISMVHLLGSSLALKDWESKKENKFECTLLSCASGIICKHTAYVLVDPTQSVPVNAPMSKLTAGTSRRRSYTFESSSSDSDSDDDCENENEDDEILPKGRQYKNRVYSILQKKCKKMRTRAILEGDTGIDLHSSHPLDRDRVTLTQNKSISIYSARSQSSSQSRSRSISPTIQSRGGRGGGRGGAARSRSKRKRTTSPSETDMYTTGSTSYQSITCLQRAEGSWEYSEKLEQELNLDLKATCPDGISLTLWTTMVCISCLRVNFSTFQTQWLLVVKKGECWAKQELSTLAHKLSYKELIDSATIIVSNP